MGRRPHREDREPVVLKPENRLAEVVLGLLAIFAPAIVLRD